MPKSHQYQSLKTNPGSFLNWANNIGINTVYWVKKELKSVKHPPNVYNKGHLYIKVPNATCDLKVA